MYSSVLLARPAQGVVGKAECVCHVIPIPDGALPEEITALCGATFGHGQLERVDGPLGMPCEACLLRATDAVARRLSAIERMLSELESQFDAMKTTVPTILDDQRRNEY